MYDTGFSIANNIALIGWAGLILFPSVHWITNIVARWVIPFGLAAFYATLLVMYWGTVPDGADLGTINGIQTFFSVDGLMLAGWMHFIAWDLFAASWILEDSRKVGIHHLLVVPCLVLAYLLGPNALLIYAPMRLIFVQVKKHQTTTA